LVERASERVFTISPVAWKYSIRSFAAKSNEADGGLRSTIHVPDGDDTLVQVLDYVGDQRGGATKGRRFSVSCGAIGKACRERQACGGARDTEDREAFIRELIREYGD
jgi:hypothetical protein